MEERPGDVGMADLSVPAGGIGHALAAAGQRRADGHERLHHIRPALIELDAALAELEQIELDLSRLNQSKSRIVEEISHYQDLLAESKRHSLLRRVK